MITDESNDIDVVINTDDGIDIDILMTILAMKRTKVLCMVTILKVMLMMVILVMIVMTNDLNDNHDNDQGI